MDWIGDWLQKVVWSSAIHAPKVLRKDGAKDVTVAVIENGEFGRFLVKVSSGI